MPLIVHTPKQESGETVDSRSDVYSTGCLLYELLARRPAFEGEGGADQDSLSGDEDADILFGNAGDDAFHAAWPAVESFLDDHRPEFFINHHLFWRCKRHSVQLEFCCVELVERAVGNEEAIAREQSLHPRVDHPFNRAVVIVSTRELRAAWDRTKSKEKKSTKTS